ncbi:MAG: hypothetical protein AAF661_04960 [Pseudomonadota bacterium]
MQAYTPRLKSVAAEEIELIEREDMGHGAAIVTLIDGSEKKVPAIQARQWPDTSIGRWHLVEVAGGEMKVMRSDAFEALFEMKG